MILELNNITKSYQRGKRKISVFSQFDISVEEGELLILSGKSGSGKSTLLALMGGYLKADEGRILFRNENLSEKDDYALSSIHANEIAYLPQSNVMISEFTIMENICLKALILGDKTIENKAIKLMELMNILPLADRYPSELSGGELRRVALARMFLNEARLYLVDEPSNGLEQAMVQTIMQYMQKCIKDGSTIIVATHDEAVKAYGSRMIEIANT